MNTSSQPVSTATAGPAASGEAPAATFGSRVAALASDIKLSHSVFALPFALLAAFLAAASREAQRLPRWGTVLLVVVCMVLARTVAMAVNRWADSRIDAGNPRTAKRAIPSGRLSSGFVLASAVVCAIAFIGAAACFWLLNDNPWPLMLAPAVLAWLCAYSYMKRFTWLCHVFLGSALALSPLAAAIAVEPSYLREPAPWLLAGMVLCWVAGFDIIYALQDVKVDAEQGLHSMPSRLGVEPALWISRLLHVGAVALLVLMWRSSESLRLGFAVGIALMAALLILEHALVWRSEQRRIHMAFFTVNGVISLLLGSLGIMDAVMSR